MPGIRPSVPPLIGCRTAATLALENHGENRPDGRFCQDQRADLVAGYAQAAGRQDGVLAGPLMTWLAGERLEPLARSLRVSSDRFSGATGWIPRRGAFGTGWLDAALASEAAPR